jgi:amino acid transporter
VLALAVAGSAGIGLTLPVTLAIVTMLAVLVICYRQVIAAYPDGGGAYAVARRNLGWRAGLVAAASLVIDYVLNVAVSVAAGVAALTSAFPALLPWTVELCLLVLTVVTAVNLRGVLTGGRLFTLPAVVFVLWWGP